VYRGKELRQPLCGITHTTNTRIILAAPWS
jgi:hypothetical protein